MASSLCGVTLYTYFAWPYYQTDSDYYLASNLTSILINAQFLFISIYLLLYIFQPKKSYRFHLSLSLLLSILVTIGIYYTFYVSGHIFQESYAELSSGNNKIFFLNFTILLLFWYEYSKQKHNLSEYLTNIIVLYTIIVGVEIMHIFMIKSVTDVMGDFHLIGQYFTGILNFLSLIVWIMRLNYLQTPQSKENEHFIKNYNVLYGFMEKPRTGYIERTYQKVNPRVFWVSIVIIGILCSSLLLINHFNLFVKRNVLLLTISLVVSIVLAILYWNKRWYQAIGFLIRKKKKNK